MTGGCNGMQVSYMLQHSVRLCTNTHHSCILGQSTSAKEHTCVITMNTRLNTCILAVFSVTLRGKASPRLMQLFSYIVDLVIWAKWFAFSLANRNCSVPAMWI
jgi:hypothetical protein